ncbi:hypothetical protein MPY17_13895 [Rhodococcus opacus]|uniref:hypothetical protein n=1 Tax=Rhodococcus opacus TaxID=37919 RepID=UPI001FF20C7C|nr:hypothetical protein [Rhodococcus opacus]UOT06761.1 hypothetical protein MPY17_13895 [Rhodococcus opacus]
MANTNIERATQELTQLFDKAKHGVFNLEVLGGLTFLRSVVTEPLSGESSIDISDAVGMQDILREIDHHARRYPSATVSGDDKFSVTDKVQAVGLLIRVDDRLGKRALGERRKAASRVVGIGPRELYWDSRGHLRDFLLAYVVYLRDVLANPETRRQIVTEVADVQRLRSGDGQDGSMLPGDGVQPQGNDQPSVPRLLASPRGYRWRLRLLVSGVVAFVLTVVGVAGLGINRYVLDTSSADEVDVSVLQARYDGKDPRGLDGAESRCADPPPSQLVVGASEPPLVGPDGSVVGRIQLRSSVACPTVIWARVVWADDPNSVFQVPVGWTVHVIAHRAATSTAVDEPERGGAGPVPYLLSKMLVATKEACVYVEAYFESSEVRMPSAQSSCVGSSE